MSALGGRLGGTLKLATCHWDRCLTCSPTQDNWWPGPSTDPTILEACWLRGHLTRKCKLEARPRKWMNRHWCALRVAAIGTPASILINDFFLVQHHVDVLPWRNNTRHVKTSTIPHTSSTSQSVVRIHHHFNCPRVIIANQIITKNHMLHTFSESVENIRPMSCETMWDVLLDGAMRSNDTAWGGLGSGRNLKEWQAKRDIMHTRRIMTNKHEANTNR